MVKSKKVRVTKSTFKFVKSTKASAKRTPKTKRKK
jgi:hypothetical protein